MSPKLRPNRLTASVPLRRCVLACRFDVYVCTAAERQYALEVWRLLDKTNAIIPVDKRKERVVNVVNMRKKTLYSSLGLVAKSVEAYAPAMLSADDDKGVFAGVVGL